MLRTRVTATKTIPIAVGETLRVKQPDRSVHVYKITGILFDGKDTTTYAATSHVVRETINKPHIGF